MNIPSNPVRPDVQEFAQFLLFVNGSMKLMDPAQKKIQFDLERALIDFTCINETDPLDAEDDDCTIALDVNGDFVIGARFNREISTDDRQFLRSIGCKTF